MSPIIQRIIASFVLAVSASAVPVGLSWAQSNRAYQQQQQWQRQQDQQRQQQQQQAQQRQQMQEQQRQQMQAQQRQQMQAQQRQQMQAQQRQQVQQQQRTAEQQRQLLQRQGRLGTMQDGKPTGMVVAGGTARMNRPLTAGEIQRGFTGKVTTDGRALVKFQNRVFAVPASRISGLGARLAAQRDKQKAAQWTTPRQAMVAQKVKGLTNTRSGSLSSRFAASANTQSRIDAARATRGTQGNPVGTIGMSGAAANMPHEFKRQAEAKAPSDRTATRLPYESLSRAREIVLRQPQKFVRVHGDGNQARSWLMRPEEIRGLTALQIKDKFAIPDLPKYISDVNVPAGTRMRVGTVKAHAGWGRGGGTQYELKGEHLPNSAFENKRLIK